MYICESFLQKLACEGILIRCKLYSKQKQEVLVTPSGRKDSAALTGEKKFCRKNHGAGVMVNPVSPNYRIPIPNSLVNIVPPYTIP